MAFVQTAQDALHYEVVDQTAPWQVQGLPILFHHGIGSSSMLWRGWYPALIDRFPLVIFDMRGCGRLASKSERCGARCCALRRCVSGCHGYMTCSGRGLAS